MKTEIRIEAEMTDEQLDALLSHLIQGAEWIGVKLKVESSKLNQHDVIIQVCDCVEPMISADKKTCLVCGLKLEYKR